MSSLAKRSGVTIASVATVALFSMLVLPRPAIPLIDGDVWWHIRAGQEVLQTGRIADVDTWSIVGAGMPWTSQDWLSNVILALGYRLGEIGPTVLSFIFSLVVAAAMLLLWQGIGVRDPRVGWFARIVCLAVGLTVAGPVVGVRVQVVDLPLAAASVVVLWHFLTHRRPAVLAWLPVISIAWANLHAGWVLLPLFGTAVIVGEGGDRLLRRRLDPPPLGWRQLGWLAGWLLAALLAISLNPNGPALYLYPLETAAIQAHRDFLAEWSSPDLSSLPGQLYIGFVALGVVPAFLVGWRRMRLADAFILGGVTVMAATAARFLLIAGPIGAVVVAVVLAPRLSSTSVGRTLGPTLRRMAGPPPNRRASRVNAALVGVVLVAGVAITLARVGPASQQQAIDDHMPVAAVDWIVAHNPGSRPFNTYSWGGYLGLRRPDVPVYIDGRSDVYGDGPIRQYADAISLRTDPRVLLDGAGIDHVLFNTSHPFAEWLDESPTWRAAYSDEQASVWVRVRADR